MIFKAVNEESDDNSFIVVSNSDESVYSESGSEVIEVEEFSNLENHAFLEEAGSCKYLTSTKKNAKLSITQIIHCKKN